MSSNLNGRFRRVLGGLALAAIAASATAEPKHGIAMYGEPALPPDFVSLPYVDPHAPKGGRLISGNVGGFDSLNPYVITGNPPWQLRFLISEGLMYRSQDEPFTVYGLLAESIETPEDRQPRPLSSAAHLSSGPGVSHYATAFFVTNCRQL